MKLTDYIKTEPSRNPMKDLHGDEFFNAWDDEFRLKPIEVKK